MPKGGFRVGCRRRRLIGHRWRAWPLAFVLVPTLAFGPIAPAAELPVGDAEGTSEPGQAPASSRPPAPALAALAAAVPPERDPTRPEPTEAETGAGPGDGDGDGDTGGHAGDDTGGHAGSQADPGEEGDAAAAAEASVPEPFELLGQRIEPGARARLDWHAGGDLAGVRRDTPVLVVHGERPGPVLCLSSAVHGDELNGIEVVRRIVHNVDPEELSGTLVGVPVVNLSGFQRASRYLPDRRDLNRYFPGNPLGSLASRIAYSFFESIVRRCDRMVDLHTGSFHRTNLPQLRADLGAPEVREMTHGFGAISVMHSRGGPGTLRRAATEAGVPTVTIEAGEPLRLQLEQVRQGVEAIEAYMAHLGMTSRLRLFGAPQPVYYKSSWVRANRSGILLAEVDVGDTVEAGQVLARVIDPVTNEQEALEAPFAGRVLGMALNQIVLPGFAAFRIGVATREDSLSVEGGEGDDGENGHGASLIPAPDRPALPLDEPPEPSREPEIHDP